MAVYTSGTINSATPATALMTALDTHITANGWTFVETYTSGTNISNIYKSPGASNSFGTDFYVGLNRTSTTSDVALFLCELYDSSTHYARKYAPPGLNAIPDTDYTVVDATGIYPDSASFQKAAVITRATSSLFTWYANVTVDRMIFGSSAGDLVYVGLFDTLIPGDSFPICVCKVGGGSTAATTYGAVTRELNQTSATANNWAVQTLGTTVSSASNSLAYGVLAQGTSALLYTGNVPVQRIVFFSSRNTTTGVRGLLKGVVVAGATTSAHGDTLSYTSGGTTYNYIHATNSTASYYMPQQ